MSSVNIQIINSTNIDKNIHKLSDCDIRNLTYYFHVQSHSFINIENIGQNDQENMSPDLDLNKKSTKNSQPLTNSYQFHHNYRPNHQRRRPYTKHFPDKPKTICSETI